MIILVKMVYRLLIRLDRDLNNHLLPKKLIVLITKMILILMML